jgi:pimeloyl-ACP methyl ester carboxylesterase
VTWRADGPAPPDPSDVGAVDSSEVLVDGPWQHRFVAANGARFHIAEAGEGPLVLFLHGFPQFWWAWRHQLPAVAGAGYHAVAMDLRGYGASDKPPRGYDTATLAADVAGVVRALGESRAIVAGHDWGGWLAWAMPSLTPRVTRAVAVVSMAHPLQMRTSAFRRAGRGAGFSDVLAFQVPMRPERRLAGGDGVERVLRDWSAGGSYGSGGPGGPAADLDGYPDADTLRRYRRAMRVPFVAHSSMEYYRWAVRSVPRRDGRRFAAAVREPLQVPVLQLHGALDPYIAPDDAVASHRWAGPHLRYELVPDAGHFLPEEAPDAVTAALLDWLAALPPDPT